MRITTWNVNGIRNPFGYAPWNTVRTFPAMFDILQSDIVVMQELKIQRKDLRDDMVLLDGWDCYFSLPKHKKGYSGVGIYTRNETCSPIKAEEGILGVLNPPNSTLSYRELPEDQSIGGYPSEAQIVELGVDPALLDAEGRCVCLEFPAFVLFGVYSPANSNGLRDDFRYGFLCALDCRIRNLVKAGKRVILVGDLNVSRAEIDTACALDDIKKAGMTHDDYISTPNRRVFNHLIVGGEVVGPRDEGREDAIMCDIVRDFHPKRSGMYTHWEQKINARPGNFGSRIDFVLVSDQMGDWFSEADIQEGLMGSDHCPVYGHFKDLVQIKTPQGDSKPTHILDILNPPGHFKDGKRLVEWSVKNIPAFSGKLLPEFDKRRSIKDMFKKPSMSKMTSSTQSTNGEVQKESIDSGSEAVYGNTLSDALFEPSTMTHDETLSQPSPTKSAASMSPGTKRKGSILAAPKPVKRQKSTGVPQSQKGESQKGQQSLKGFFAPKSVPATSNVVPRRDSGGSTNGATSRIADSTDGIDSQSATNGTSEYGSRDTSTAPDPPQAPSPSPSSPDSGTVHDPVAAKASWDNLMRKPNAPLCESHNEPCKVMLTKKKGENQGRSFWMCARPLGPSGAKERGTQWRCGTFVWCSDARKSDAPG